MSDERGDADVEPAEAAVEVLVVTVSGGLSRAESVILAEARR